MTTTLVRGVSPAGAVRKRPHVRSARDMAGYRVRTSGTIGGTVLRDITKPGVSVAAYRGVTASLCDCLASGLPWCRHRLLCAWLDAHRPTATEIEVISSGRDDCRVCGAEGLWAHTYASLEGGGGRSGYFAASVKPGCECKGEGNCEGGTS